LMQTWDFEKESDMSKLLEAIKVDVRFIRSHSLQPAWYKVLKVFVLMGILAGYWFFFGLIKTAVFLAAFLFLCLAVHLTYRIKTEVWTHTWLDFIVNEEHGQAKPVSIGKYYYSAILFNALLSLVISQTLP
jgi:hypothetical protein